MIHGAAQLLTELRAVQLAMVEVDRATLGLIENISRAGMPKHWAARLRFQRAMVELQAAEAKLHFAQTTLAGKRHLCVA